MPRFVEIEERDLHELITALQYVTVRYASKDRTMVAYLKEVLSKVSSHVDNERFGCDEAAEIDHVMDFISGSDNAADETKKRGRTRVRRETRVVEESDLQTLFRDSAGKGDD